MTSYATTLSFCLQNAGAPAELCSPTLLECLTTLPFGRTYIEFEAGKPGQFVPAGPSVDTFEGINFALKSLGWSAFEWHATSEQPDENASQEANSILREGLERFGPVMVGPLTQTRSTATTLAYETSRYTAVTTLHADGGYQTSKGYETAASFLAAWRADSMEGRRGRYGLRARFETQETIPVATAIARAVPLIRAKLTINPDGGRYWGANGPQVYAGADAFSLLARDLSGEALQSSERKDLAERVFPFAARQCALAAEFFASAYKPKASANMRFQSELFTQLARLVADTSADARGAAKETALRLADAEASLHDDLR